MKTPNERVPGWIQRIADSSITFGIGYLILSDRSIHSSNIMAWAFVGVGLLATIAIQIVRRQRTKEVLA